LADEAEIVHGAVIEGAVGAALMDNGAKPSWPVVCHDSKVAIRLIFVKYFTMQSYSGFKLTARESGPVLTLPYYAL
jgi:hypothetical protein